MPDLRIRTAGAKAVGGSLNDGLLAAVIGGCRRYHERFGAPLDKLTVGARSASGAALAALRGTLTAEGHN